MVSSGFGATRRDLIVLVAAAGAFILFLLVFYLAQRSRARRDASAVEKKRYRELKAKLALTPSEEELVKRLARFMRDPGKRHLVLASPSTFNYCAQKLRGQLPEPPAGLAELRLKLGFTSQNPEAVPSSSGAVPVGTGLLIRGPSPDGAGRGKSTGKGYRAQGRVVRQEPRFLVARLVSGDPGFRIGEPVGLVFRNRAGVFSFASRVVSRDGELLSLAHSETLRRVQRRRFYRRKTNLSVGVRQAGPEDPYAASFFVDLGGEGASLLNPGLRFGPGDTVELAFQAGGGRLTLVAEVLRVSRSGERLHVRFAPMQESTRDRIIGSLFHSA